MARFALHRYGPPGDWVYATHQLSVADVRHHKPAARAFAKAARKAERTGLRYGVRVQREIQNEQHANAIAVFGVSQFKGWFRRGTREWHIGYLDSDIAAEIADDLMSNHIPVGAQLSSIYEGSDGFLNFKVIVLAPPGHGAKARQLRRARSSRK